MVYAPRALRRALRVPRASPAPAQAACGGPRGLRARQDRNARRTRPAVPADFSPDPAPASRAAPRPGALADSPVDWAPPWPRGYTSQITLLAARTLAGHGVVRTLHAGAFPFAGVAVPSVIP